MINVLAWDPETNSARIIFLFLSHMGFLGAIIYDLLADEKKSKIYITVNLRRLLIGVSYNLRLSIRFVCQEDPSQYFIEKRCKYICDQEYRSKMSNPLYCLNKTLKLSEK